MKAEDLEDLAAEAVSIDGFRKYFRTHNDTKATGRSAVGKSFERKKVISTFFTFF